MSHVDLVWEDPPTTRASDTWKAAALALASRRGEWARVACDVTENFANASARQQLKAWGCEVRVHKQRNGKGWSVWARIPK